MPVRHHLNELKYVMNNYLQHMRSGVPSGNGFIHLTSNENHVADVRVD